jgi:hypothetical protein
MVAKTLVGFVFAAAFVLTQSAAWACSSHAKTASTSEPAAPIQTAEAPTSTKTK